MTEYNTLTTANQKRNEEWDPENKLTSVFFALELAGEAGETANIVKKLERERLGIQGSRATKEMLADELSDVVICAVLVANKNGIALGPAIVKKFNETSMKLGLDIFLECHNDTVQI